jgi:hypothetical protein
MGHDASLQASRKNPPPGKAIVVALLGLHGLFLIIIGLIAFFGGFVGVYDVSHGHTTPGAMVAVLGAALAWMFLLGGIISLLCAQGLLTWQRWALWLTIAQQAHQSHRGKLCADAAAIYPVDRCFEHECCWRYPPLCADSDRRTHAFPLIMLTRRVSIDRRRTFLPAYKCRLLHKRTWLTKKSFTPLPTLLFTRSD